MSAIGQVMREPVEMDALLDRALVLSDYHRKRETFDRANGDSRVKQGIGFASFLHGAGFTGSGEVHLASVVDVEATAGRPCARARGQHGNRSGHQHDLCADHRRRAGDRIRPGGGRTA